MSNFKNKHGQIVLNKIVKVIQDNKIYLGEIDGLIGDGDHGMNMNKGFSIFEERFLDKEILFTEGLYELGAILFNEIGGSMGPIYGTLFMTMGEAGEGLDEISLKDFEKMLYTALQELYDVIDARVGDKTIVDVLAPAVESIVNSSSQDEDFKEALEKMKVAAAEGRDSTKDLVAKFGRSSRLGERSRGVLDTGATSSCMILTAMAEGIISTLNY